MPSTASSSPTPAETASRPRRRVKRIREGTAGRLKNPARSTCPRTSTLRISHFPDPRSRRYNAPEELGSPPPQRPSTEPVDNRGEPERRSSEALLHLLPRARLSLVRLWDWRSGGRDSPRSRLLPARCGAARCQQQLVMRPSTSSVPAPGQRDLFAGASMRSRSRPRSSSENSNSAGSVFLTKSMSRRAKRTGSSR